MANEFDDFLGTSTAVPSHHHAYLEERILKAIDHSQTKKALKLEHITKANVQTVGGVLYTIEAVISLDAQEMNATIKLLEKLWEHSEKWNFNCAGEHHRFTLKMERRVKCTKKKEPRASPAQDDTAKICNKIVSTLQKLCQQSDVSYALVTIVSMVKKFDTGGCKYDIKVKLMRSNLGEIQCQMEMHEDPSGNFQDVLIQCDDKVYQF